MALYTLLTLLFGFASTVIAFPQPLAITGNWFFAHDPSLVQRASDGKYFLFSTHNGGQMITATNLAGPWTITGSIINGDSVINLPGNDDIWAPDVHFYNNEYIAYYCISTFGTQVSAIGLATSPTMEPGTWTDHGQVYSSTTGDQFNAIDPNFVVDQNGIPTLTFGSFWADIFQINLESNLMTPSTGAGQVSFNSTSPQAEEGAFVWPHGGYFYLFFSSGQCCGFDASALPPAGSEYKACLSFSVFVGRSTSAHGPYVDAKGVALTSTGGTLVLASHDTIYAPGGQSIFTDSASGKDIFVYHYIPTNSADPYSDTYASLGLNAIDWSSGWPVLVNI